MMQLLKLIEMLQGVCDDWMIDASGTWQGDSFWTIIRLAPHRSKQPEYTVRDLTHSALKDDCTNLAANILIQSTPSIKWSYVLGVLSIHCYTQDTALINLIVGSNGALPRPVGEILERLEAYVLYCKTISVPKEP